MSSATIENQPSAPIDNIYNNAKTLCLQGSKASDAEHKKQKDKMEEHTIASDDDSAELQRLRLALHDAEIHVQVTMSVAHNMVAEVMDRAEAARSAVQAELDRLSKLQSGNEVLKKAAAFYHRQKEEHNEDRANVRKALSKYTCACCSDYKHWA